MSRIPLRKYVQEIEVLIENGNLDEAQKHCLYVLKTFPKSIAIYRLLGKILMEKGEYEDAVYLFEKVLEVIPDDFISHVGLSFIAEVREQLDDAVMHMERAFELQPTNALLKEELKRLHLKKDSIEPQTIRLTRGALVNMYLRSTLYPQAIAELNIGLQTNPNRIDFKERLAEALLYQGDKIAAVQTSIDILGKAPFSFSANRIAYEALPSTSEALDIQAFHRHLIEIDPYYTYVGDRIKAVEDVPDVAVSIERYNGKEPPIDLANLNVQEEIEKYWNKPNSWKDQEALNAEIAWDSILDKKLANKQEETKAIAIDFVPETAGEAIEEPIEEKDNLEQGMEINEQPSGNEIPGWIFDNPEEARHDDAPARPSTNSVISETPPAMELSQNESGMVDQDVPTISEPESEIISKHWVKIENGQVNQSQSSLEDTRKIRLQESDDEIYASALRFIEKNEFHTAIQSFNALLEKSAHVEDIIQTLEHSTEILKQEPDSWYVLGKAYQKNNQKEKALHAFRKAEETSLS